MTRPSATVVSAEARALLANPFETKLVSKTTLKTHRVASEELAKLARLQAIPESYVPTPEQRALRKLVRERVFYTQLWTGVANHFYAVPLQKGISFRPRLLQRRTSRHGVADPCFPEIERGLQERGSIEELTHSLYRTTRDAFEASPEAQLLAAIPGGGKSTSVALVTCLCPIDRFSGHDAVAKYCGLCPAVHQSATRSCNGPLVWDANHLLKWVLVEAQWSVRRNGEIGDVYRVGYRVARRKGMGSGTVADARKLARITASVLRRRSPYQPHAPGLSRCQRPIATS